MGALVGSGAVVPSATVSGRATNFRRNCAGPAFGLPAGSVKAPAATVTAITPAVTGDSSKVNVVASTAVKLLSTALDTFRSDCAKPLTGSLRVSVTGTGAAVTWSG